MRGKDVEHAFAARERKIRENIAALKADIANLQATIPGLDVISPLDVASQYPGSRIIVLSSGASTKAPVDIPRLGWSFDPAQVAESVHRQGVLNLTGKHVTYFGLGITGGSVQPRLPAYARKLLEELWIAICQKAGAASCELGDGEPSAAAPRATLPVPVVPVPATYTEAGSGCVLWQRFSDRDQSLRFAPNSSELPESANELLGSLVESVKRCDVHRVDVVGHIAATTPDGRDDSNLSGRRARAAADRLVQLGLPSPLLGSVVGRGAREPVVANITPDGRFIEAAAAQNRRVEITLTR